jgi:outer membrane lipoprotein-sorting protein
MTILLLNPFASNAQGDKKSSDILNAMSSKYQKIKSFKALFTYIAMG